MKVIKFAVALSLALGLLTLAFVGQAKADTTQSQSEDQHFDVNCSTSGSYGQNTTCNVTGDQNQSQTQVLGVMTSNRSNLFHKPVDTGLDTLSSAAAAGSLIIGSAATFIKIKSRV